MAQKKVNLENVLFILVFFSGTIISLFDLFGILNLDIISSKISTITLLIISLFVGYYVLFNQNKINKIDTSLEVIRNLSLQEGIKQIDAIKGEIEPFLREIFEDKIDEITEVFSDFILKKKLVLNDMKRFWYYYSKIMDAVPKETIYATSLAESKYGWSANNELNQLEKSIKNFIDKGGEYIRIFFINENEINNKEIKTILDKQKKLGVKVYTILNNKLPNRLKKLNVYIKNNSIGIFGAIDKNMELVEIVFTSDSYELEKLKAFYEQLMSLDELQVY